MIVVGAPGRDSARGVAYSFRRTGRNAAWSAPTVIARGADAGVRLGAAIALDGSRALIGAPGSLPLGGNPGGSPPQFKPGSAAIHALGSDGTWTDVAQIAPGTDTVRAFGYQVHLAGPEAMVSSPLANRGRGTIYVFSESAGTWSITGKLAAAAAGGQELLGLAFAVTSGQVLAGAPMASQGTGAVYVFARGEAGWQETQKLTTTASGLGVMLGWAVAASGWRPGRRRGSLPGANWQTATGSRRSSPSGRSMEQSATPLPLRSCPCCTTARSPKHSVPASICPFGSWVIQLTSFARWRPNWDCRA